MKIKRISILNEFRCTAGDCPANCCRNNWKVPIDHDTYIKFRSEKGALGILLRFSTVKKHGIAAFRNTFRGCPFLGMDHLCGIQKKYGTSYMPLVCIQFPRQLYNLAFFCEETLYLACPEAARLFLASAAEDRPFEFVVSEGNVNYKVNTTNDDKDFLDYLLKARDELIVLLKNGISFDSMAILNYGRDAQNACLGKTTLPSPLDMSKETIYPEHYQMSCEQIHSLLFNGFYHPRLRTISPLLYKLCHKYIRKFGRQGKTNSDSADRKLAALKKSIYEKIPDWDKFLNRYYEYYLLTNFLNIFEDYSFSKHLLFGIVKTELLWLFIALYAEEKNSVNPHEIATVMAIYERRAPQLKDAL